MTAPPINDAAARGFGRAAARTAFTKSRRTAASPKNLMTAYRRDCAAWPALRSKLPAYTYGYHDEIIEMEKD